MDDRKDLQKLINLINSAAESKNGEKVYGDEPIVFTASQMKNFTPLKIAEMKKIASSKEMAGASPEKIFYCQGKFMQDYNDDYRFSGEFVCYFPTYRDMTVAELRGFFSWRTKIRNGKFEKAPVAFGLIYLYELINGIGVSSPEDGFEKLKKFEREYAGFSRTLLRYTKNWIKDYAVYYGIDPSKAGYNSVAANDSLATLLKYPDCDKQSLLNAIENFSSYKITNFSFFKKYPEDTAEVIFKLFGILSEYYDKHSKYSIAENLFGNFEEYEYFMFGSAVFYAEKPHKDTVYKVNDFLEYECRDGVWICRRFFCRKDKAGKVGTLLKTVDSRLRLKTGFKSQLKPLDVSKLFSDAIDKAIGDYYYEKERRKVKKISIDLSKIDNIRAVAEQTREKLIVNEEDLTEETAVCTKPANEITAEPEPENKYLAQTEKNEKIPYPEIIKDLLEGGNGKSAAAKYGVMLSVAAESINEALYDIIGDIVIDFDGDAPILIEDYVSDLKGLLKP